MKRCKEEERMRMGANNKADLHLYYALIEPCLSLCCSPIPWEADPHPNQNAPSFQAERIAEGIGMRTRK